MGQMNEEVAGSMYARNSRMYFCIDKDVSSVFTSFFNWAKTFDEEKSIETNYIGGTKANERHRLKVAWNTNGTQGRIYSSCTRLR
ncbi:uncharacterized protein LOC127244226 isoform X2 [Andrographis paniculata]|nr:uncharacterized protein LOC127244226 isoform X2 [Andrographis paniculata]